LHAMIQFPRNEFARHHCSSTSIQRLCHMHMVPWVT
jgi:hypothetical protein